MPESRLALHLLGHVPGERAPHDRIDVRPTYEVNVYSKPCTVNRFLISAVALHFANAASRLFRVRARASGHLSHR